MEKDETVGESSPHIANIGRLVEVRGTVPVPWLINDRPVVSIYPLYCVLSNTLLFGSNECGVTFELFYC